MNLAAIRPMPLGVAVKRGRSLMMLPPPARQTGRRSSSYADDIVKDGRHFEK